MTEQNSKTEEKKATQEPKATAAQKEDKPKKESILAQAKKMAGEKKTGKSGKKSEKTKEPKEVKKGPARVFTVPLRGCRPRTKKTRKAVAQLKTFILKHTKQEAVIDPALNEYLWSRGRKKPPARVRVSVEATEDGKSLVSLKK
ncbi:MAG: 50S ribosomal protein L31e [archaeon]